MKNGLKICLTFILGIWMMTSCDLLEQANLDEDEVVDIYALIESHESLSTLKSILDQDSQLASMLQDDGQSFTFFAPNNQAINAMMTQMGVSNIADLDSETLSNIIKNHLVSGSKMKTEAMSDGSSLMNMYEESLKINKSGSEVTINETAKIIEADIEATNGVVHLIDQSLLPEALIPVENEFRFMGESYALTWGFYQDYGTYEGYTNWDFILMEKEENLNEIESEDDIQSDHYLAFWLESQGSTFNTGKYPYNANGFEEASGNFLYDGTLFKRENGVYQEYFVIGGMLEVDKQGNDYIITFDLEMENGESLRGHQRYPFEEPPAPPAPEIANNGDNQESDFNFYINDIRFPLEVAEIVDYGSNGSSYNYDFFVYSRDVFNASEFTGLHYFYFELFANSGSEFLDGTYNYGTGSGTNYFDYAFFEINYDMSSMQRIVADAGSVDVSVGSETFSISFDITDASGNIITGMFEGPYAFSKTAHKSLKRNKFKNLKRSKLIKK